MPTIFETVVAIVLLAVAVGLWVFAWPIGRFIDSIYREIEDELSEAGHQTLRKLPRRTPLDFAWRFLNYDQFGAYYAWTLRVISAGFFGGSILLFLISFGVIKTA